MKFKMTEKVGDWEFTKDFEGEVEELLAIYLEVFMEQQVVKEFNIYELEEYYEVSEAVMKLMYKLVECGMINKDEE